MSVALARDEARPVAGGALVHPVALAAIAVLVLNDHLGKAAFPGVITGKLSDLAGLAFFPLFLQAGVEIALAAAGRPWVRSDRVLWGAMALTAVVFALVKLDTTETGARIEGTVQVASVDVKDENLTAHLQSPDFFDAERYPELRFLAEGVDLDNETVEAPGEITIKGVAKPVEVTGTLSEPIEDAWGNERLGLQLTATVDRTEFGVNWNTPLPTGDQALSNIVTILAELQLVKAA